MRRIVLGIDGGGTKTRCLAADARDGRILGEGLAGPSNYQVFGIAGAVQAVMEAATQAMAAALAELVPGLRLVASAGSPADGAVWLARQL